MSIRVFRAGLLILGFAVSAGDGAAQNSGGSAVIIGTVVRKETGDSLGYSVVSAPSIGREQFTNDRGRFTMRDLPAGALRLRFKHIGFTPRDTVVTVGDGDTLRIRVALATLVMQLPAMRISGACGDKRVDPKNAGVLAELFDQVQQNAERYRLLAQTHPFEMLVQRARGTRRGDRFTPVMVDTVTQPALTVFPYVPGHLIREERTRGAFRPTYYLSVPELTDFADTAFSNNHCFTYAGRDKVNGVPVIVVEYEPVPALRKSADVRGTMFVREEDYQLVRAEMELTGIPKELAGTNLRGVRVRTSFVEIVPGVAIIELLESTNEFYRMSQMSGERGAVIDVKWLKGPP